MKHSVKSSRRSAAGKGAWRITRSEKIALVRKNWKRLVGVYAMVWALFLPVLIWAPFNDLWRGLLIGLTLASGRELWHILLQGSGISTRQMGAEAERWTASELSKFDPKRWFVLHDLPSPSGNIDHVAIGPDGILVIETKWTSAGDNLAFLTPGARQAEANARLVRTHLASHGVIDRNVIPTLVVWGPGTVTNDAEPYLDGDTTIVMGAHATTWRQHFEQSNMGTEPDRIALTAIATPFAGAAQSTDGHDRERPTGVPDSGETDGEIAIVEWQKYGKHRLYANLAGSPESVGWIDLNTGKIEVNDQAPRNAARVLRRARQAFLASAAQQTERDAR